ncbi:hypothetical protein P43SY_001053 [Pythium insidiosum]|uniref:Saccharopine dehydrogenase (NAD(+), L-glutamate-forming) n=1 Tax=Pythium insidiosum TaxID=114742 RepID=A0AAD5Q312_PYTIN|nr:hypothetical protein P43SY_001053 [Pythium insidiosum]
MASTGSKCVGIVREVYNKWERRVPLTPTHVRQLVQRGVSVVIQPSNSRIFPDEQYALAGATVTDDLSAANVIVGVKQVPVDKLLPEKTYMFFSHTIKAQPENMELLDTVLQRKITLIDYECITEEGERNGKRLIAFGGNAGRAGMVAGFRGMGERLINMGYSTPFVNVGSAYMYTDLERAKEAVEYAGKKIQTDGLPSDLAPMTFVFTGNGNVSKGAQEIFRLMPHQMVDPSELGNLPKDKRVLYGTVVEAENMVRPIDPSHPFSVEDYYRNPHLYEGKFHEAIAPHSSMIVNCMYWDDRYPRLLTRQQIAELRASGNHKLVGIADISCDIGGSMEFLEYSTEIERPFALYDVQEGKMRDELDGDGVLMMSVDILPSELARESSQQFGDKLLSYMDILAGVDARLPLKAQKQLPKELTGACIAANGILTPNYISPEMKQLNDRAKQAGVPILCELGLDPGMDHMSAMKVIDEVKSHDGKVVSFSSVCGGLPAPEAADNPIGYKFSWSPRGVLTAALNAALYKKDGKIINVPGEDLLKSNERVNFLPAFAIEQIPNRNSIPYGDIYGIPDAHTIFRGTLRYAGCCDILYQLRQFGLFNTDTTVAQPSSWPELIRELSRNSKIKLQPDAEQFLHWLGVHNENTPFIKGPSIIDTFCTLLQEKLAYQPGERDLAIMHHEFGVEYADGRKEKRTSTYVGYGSENGDTVMAKTVGVTAAIGVQMILQDAVQSRGVLTPTTPDIYAPGLARLEAEGIRFSEKTFQL